LCDLKARYFCAAVLENGDFCSKPVCALHAHPNADELRHSCPEHAGIPLRNCALCGQPGTFIRTRYFEHSISHVWTCSNELCQNFRLYWHSDHAIARAGNQAPALKTP
jgi:hypothetical protein